MEAESYFFLELNLFSFDLLRLLVGHDVASPLLLQSRLSLQLLLGFWLVSVDDTTWEVQQADGPLSTRTNQPEPEGKLIKVTT